jgi:very-short-patch-repair endonuclease
MRPEIFTRTQLLGAGLSSSTITRNYTRLLPQIYCLGDPTTFARCCALAQWQPKAVLSHRTAAWLYGWAEEPRLVEVTVPTDMKVRAPRWLTVYRRSLPAGEYTEIQGLPVICRERTLIDCVAVMSDDDSARIVDERLASDTDVDTLEWLMRSTPKLRGNERARKQLRGASRNFASEPERVLDRAIIRQGFRMKTNHRVGRYICDFVDELAKLIVEVDGREFHIEPLVFSKDRRRQNHLVLAGWMVLRYSAVDVMADPDGIAREIADLLRRRRSARR